MFTDRTPVFFVLCLLSLTSFSGPLGRSNRMPCDPASWFVLSISLSISAPHRPWCVVSRSIIVE